jgi:hypothetical protein
LKIPSEKTKCLIKKTPKAYILVAVDEELKGYCEDPKEAI